MKLVVGYEKVGIRYEPGVTDVANKYLSGYAQSVAVDVIKVQSVNEAGEYSWSYVANGIDLHGIVSQSAVAEAQKAAAAQGLELLGIKEETNPKTGEISHFAKLGKREEASRREKNSFWQALNDENIVPRLRDFPLPPSNEELLQKCYARLEAQKSSLRLAAKRLIAGPFTNNEYVYAEKLLSRAADNILCRIPELDADSPFHGQITPTMQSAIVAEVSENFFAFTSRHHDNRDHITVPNGISGRRVNKETEAKIARKVEELFGHISSLAEEKLAEQSLHKATPAIQSFISPVNAIALSGVFLFQR